MKLCNKTVLNQAVVAAIAATAGLSAPTLSQARYMSGDFHNHTTCTDGSTSVQTLTNKSLTYLDYFIQAGHSGDGNRDCRIDDFAYNGPSEAVVQGPFSPPGTFGPPGQGNYWVNTIGEEAIKGDVRIRTSYGAPAGTRSMWRWQSLQEFVLPNITPAAEQADKPAFLGLEWTVPGHEHTSAAIVEGQYDQSPNTDLIAQFEYCFGAPANDTSGGGGQGWTCDISNEHNTALFNRFTDGTDLKDQGPPNYNASLIPQGGVNTNDTGDHVKSTAAIYWMREHAPESSYAVQAHLERNGPFVGGSNRGYDVSQIRDWNDAGPDIAFGFESQPGHQAQYNRGGYSADRGGNPLRTSIGLFTFGGTGCYAGAEPAQPGFKFSGNGDEQVPLTQQDFLSGEFEKVNDAQSPERVVVCRPGVRTTWDALLSEGRRFWFFASSDWHNRGSYGPFERPSNNDFWPGEYQKNYSFVRARNPQDPGQDIVDSLRSGDSYATMGDLIEDMRFRACVGRRCAGMGGTLKVNPGDDVTVYIMVKDPRGANHSPYRFPNPALLQLGITERLDRPTLRQVDLIEGVVSGKFLPTDAGYRRLMAPPTTVIANTWTEEDWTRSPWKRMRYTLQDVTENMYVRVRGSNLPAGTPYERDANGNPLRDDIASDNISCLDPACPPHVDGRYDADIEAWSDLMFFGNPIFIEIIGMEPENLQASN